MKRAFISILLFYYIVHFIIPGIYFLIMGSFNTYTDVDDSSGIIKGFLLNSIKVLGTISIINFMPDKKITLPKFFKLTPLFYFSILFAVVNFFIGGGFEGKLTGSMAGSIFSYLALFLNPYIILLF